MDWAKPPIGVLSSSAKFRKGLEEEGGAAAFTMSKPSKWGIVAEKTTTDGGGKKRVTGTMIMKSVSIFLANGRRASRNGLHLRNKSKPTSVGAGNASGGNTEPIRVKRKKCPKNAIEDASGKINPKLLETYKKKTHFSKYLTEPEVRE